MELRGHEIISKTGGKLEQNNRNKDQKHKHLESKIILIQVHERFTGSVQLLALTWNNTEYIDIIKLHILDVSLKCICTLKSLTFAGSAVRSYSSSAGELNPSLYV